MKGINNNSQIKINIQKLDFIFTPLSLSTKVCLQNDSQVIYTLEVQKGCQLIRRINAPIVFSDSMNYIFKQDQVIFLKVHNQKVPQYEIVLYRSQNERIEYLHSFPLKLGKIYQQYVSQINKHDEDYLFVLNRFNNNQTLGKSWKQLKSSFQKNKQVFTTTDPLEIFTLKYSIEVVNVIDKYDNQHGQKTRVKSRSSKGSLISFSSISSKQKKQQPTLPSMEKSQNKTNQDSRIVSQLTTHLTSKNQFSPQIFQKQELKAVSQEQSPKYQSSNLFLPLQSILQKAKQDLSDIVERSNEGNSSMTYVDTERKWKQLSQIKEQDKDDIFMKVKTQLNLPNLSNSPKKEQELRRACSYSEEESKKVNRTDSHVKFKEEDEYLMNQKRQDNQTSTRVLRETSFNPRKLSQKKMHIVAFIVCILWFIFSLAGMFFFNEGTTSPLRKKIKQKKIKKHKIAIRM